MFRFADCILDVDARRLVRSGRDVHLPPKAFELLKVLVENRPRVMTKDELTRLVWPGVFVSDASLAKAASRIRHAIGQQDDTSVVRTVHGCGYAFVPAVQAEEASAASAGTAERAVCWLFCGDREFPLAAGEHIVGRESDASIRLDSAKVSRHHAKIVVSRAGAVLIDLGSKNGSFVRGVQVREPIALAPGDDIRIGPFALVFRIAESAGSTETEIR